VIIAFFTVAGVIASILLSVRALREVQRDRELRQSPFLAFETGGWRRTVKFVRAGATIPGLNPGYVKEIFPNLPPSAESVRLDAPEGELQKSFYGRLTNFGSGAALGARVTWLAQEVAIGQDSFEITEAMRVQPPYTEDLNEMPLDPGHILAGEVAQLTRLPTFIEKDIDKKILRVDGRLQVRCTDVAGKPYSFEQAFHLSTAYSESPPRVHVAFGDLFPAPSSAATV
jgi:hypothetical protein